ncbi:FAD binding domain-containing protein [Kovacikia minuta CCNUW1]|uniref:FAD binding domain-containing protein n=1 Tax=Kovacikia minuta TaxID=2931930 RepID=UPI001CD03D9B|nr:FAD binding domain-containing protein [Kovacikia minuta]UBF26074.1 FAD binding domain-containing protein [Kovacikia minuta CCNUW1]
MDLHTIETYLRPTHFAAVDWKPGWAWLAGGTWLFSEPQPTLNTLVDLDPLGWAEVEQDEARLAIGATCTFAQLLNYPWEIEWRAIAALKDAIAALAASFKVTHLATIGGNLCLALAVGVMAPLMVLLAATYEIWSPTASARFIAAQDFQLGIQKTTLQPGEVLRRIWIPKSSLSWQTNVQRFGIAATDPALSLVMVARHPATSATRISLGACVAIPYLMEFSQLPTPEELAEALQSVNWLQDFRASAQYRQQITKVLIHRSLQEVNGRELGGNLSRDS